MSDLVVVEEVNIPKIFEKDGIHSIVEGVKNQVSGEVFDISTAKGRKACGSLAAKVARSKTYLDDLGKTYASDLKKKAKVIDGERKFARDELDELKVLVRKPLTEWEQAEEARVAKYEADIAEIVGGGDRAAGEWMTLPLEAMQDRLAEIEAQVIDDSWEEYELDASKAKANAVDCLNNAIEKRQKYDAEQAELVRLRKQQEEQAQKDRDESIRREAEAKAKREAEEAVEAGKRAQANAEARAKEAEERAERQAEAAATAERNRIEAERKAEEDDAKRREANTQHKGKINREAVAALVSEAKITEAEAKRVLVAIAKGLIPNITISY